MVGRRSSNWKHTSVDPLDSKPNAVRLVDSEHRDRGSADRCAADEGCFSQAEVIG